MKIFRLIVHLHLSTNIWEFKSLAEVGNPEVGWHVVISDLCTDPILQFESRSWFIRTRAGGTSTVDIQRRSLSLISLSQLLQEMILCYELIYSNWAPIIEQQQILNYAYLYQWCPCLWLLTLSLLNAKHFKCISRISILSHIVLAEFVRTSREIFWSLLPFHANH
jgi:hypothetical protein